MKTAFVIPVYKHGKTLESVVKKLLSFEFPIIVVDDGNTDEERALIESVEKKYDLVHAIYRKKNGGKGKAVNDAARLAFSLGCTHIFQLDADGQHDTSYCADFLCESEKNQEAVICGFPIYDESAPDIRKNGRNFANGWTHIVTLSKKVKDVLCGFRIYPLVPFMKILNSYAWLDGRMGYDIDIIVHLVWKNVPVINKGVRVSYPLDGISNFRMVRDNITISFTFTRLFIGMLLRLPLFAVRLIRRCLKKC